MASGAEDPFRPLPKTATRTFAKPHASSCCREAMAGKIRQLQPSLTLRLRRPTSIAIGDGGGDSCKASRNTLRERRASGERSRSIRAVLHGRGSTYVDPLLRFSAERTRIPLCFSAQRRDPRLCDQLVRATSSRQGSRCGNRVAPGGAVTSNSVLPPHPNPPARGEGPKVDRTVVHKRQASHRFTLPVLDPSQSHYPLTRNNRLCHAGRRFCGSARAIIERGHPVDGR